MTGDPKDLIIVTAALMEDFAMKQKNKLPEYQRAIIDALAFSEIIKASQPMPPDMTLRLRTAALVHYPHAPALAAHMDAIADRLDKGQDNTTIQ